MYLTITGKLGSGKSTICKIIADQYDFMIYSTGEIQRNIALRMGISTLDMNHVMMSDPQYDDLIDRETVEIAKKNIGKNIIFDSRMAFHFVENSYKVFVTIDPQEAANRVINTRGKEEEYSDIKDAKKKLLERSRLENERFQGIYNVNNYDYSNYNLVIDSTWLQANEVAEIIYAKAAKSGADDLLKTEIYLNPKSVYPTQRIRNINMDIVNDLRGVDKEPISIVLFEDYHYVIDGHHRLLAALLDGDSIIKARVAEKDLYPILKGNLLAEEIKYVGLSSLYDYEDCANFRYKSYPEAFND